MSAKGVQLCCYGPAGRLTVWTITTDYDGEPVKTSVYTTETEARTAYGLAVSDAWTGWFGRNAAPMPDDTEKAWGILCDQTGFMDTITMAVHDLPLPSIFA